MRWVPAAPPFLLLLCSGARPSAVRGGHQRPGGTESTRTRTISRTLNPNDGTGPVFSRAVGSRGRGVTAHTRAPKTGHPGW